MEEIQYIGEHKLPGIAGNFFVVLSFAAAIFATCAYYFSAKNPEDTQWKKAARWGFRIHALAVVGIVGSLFYILFNHLYEYKYAWDHLNNAMPMQYIMSCFWEGQEGSFLLWTIWHAVLGLLLMRWSRGWEPWVMTVVSVVQVFLASMLLGVFFGEYQFGSNPFLLMREHPDNIGLPWTMTADYLTQFPAFLDGRGLNPLLQNYWMTIHPPILFLGFAATLIPFAYAIAGLWRRDYTGWLTPAIPWTFFGVMILGTGILMGGAWAYEALGFGGFWAWDPVENASLVPWLTLLGAAHLLVVNKRKPTALFTAFLLTIGTFILILYSTFLTRSGVLGDSSVHSFVDSGILPQLLVYLLFFIALSTVLLPMSRVHRTIYSGVCAILFVLSIFSIFNYYSGLTDGVEKEGLIPGEGTWVAVYTAIFLLLSLVMMIVSYVKYFPKQQKEEALWSREFWMFIGAVVLLASAVQIMLFTSIPVANVFLAPFKGVMQNMFAGTESELLAQVMNANIAPGKTSERFDEYHRYQVPLAFLLFILSATGQYFRYKDTEFRQFLKKIALSFFVALVITTLVVWLGDFSGVDIPVIALTFSCFFSIIANADYALRVLKGKLDHIGASVAHIGFALLMLGAVLSMSRQNIISRSNDVDLAQLSSEFKNNEDLMMNQDDTVSLGDYFAVYRGKEWQDERLICTVDYLEKTPIQYKQGTKVTNRGLLFYCTEDHIASTNFMHDWQTDSVWSFVPADHHDAEHARLWQSGTPGKKLFTLEPSVLSSPKGNSREPSINHTISHDLYTYLKFVDTEKADTSGYQEPISNVISVGEEVELTSTIHFSLDSLVQMDSIPPDLPPGVKIKRGYATLHEKDVEEKIILPVATMNDSIPIPFPTEPLNFRMRLSLVEKDGNPELTIQLHKSMKKDFIVYHAVVFPQINVLWIGCIIMVIGTTMAIRHRIRLSRVKPPSAKS
ncbi:MAG: cytochrome c biogenesis protein CcsA [Flavobacteriales bacterium]|nr:cytochrome c biogenesis protein CcsA [Flavobacteriales bacterium]